jgi:hypothetical protein
MVGGINMCIICIDIEKGKLTAFEALQNFGEMQTQLTQKHAEELATKIIKAINEESAKEFEHED